MTLDSWLFIILGLVQTWTAVQGGIVSARTLPSGRERNIHIGMFVLLGILGIGLITWQAINVSRSQKAAESQQKVLSDKIDQTQSKLDKAQESLNISLLTQERMKGSLDTLQMLAGKIGQNSSSDWKQLVTAVSRVAETGHVATLTNKQLCDRAFGLAKRLREFAFKTSTADSDAITTEQNALMATKTEEEKEALREKFRAATLERFQANELQFRSDFVAEAIFLRDEISKRLPSVPQPKDIMQGMIFRGTGANPWGINGAADYMEILGKTLCTQ